jgi:hypothetical protein
MSPETFEKLIDLRDGVLGEAEKSRLLQQIDSDPQIKQEWQLLNEAVTVIADAGLARRVAQVAAMHSADQATPVVEMRTAPVRRMSTMLMRVAAVVVLVLGAFTAYRMVNSSPDNLYGQYYVSYDLNTARGASASTALEQAYRTKNWQVVDAEFKKSHVHDQSAYFLHGMSQLESKQFYEAAADFKNVLALNKTASQQRYQDEAEYYLAMSYLAAGNKAAAEPILEAIQKDAGHLYHERVK